MLTGQITITCYLHCYQVNQFFHVQIVVEQNYSTET